MIKFSLVKKIGGLFVIFEVITKLLIIIEKVLSS